MRQLFRWNKETNQLEELVEYRGKPRPAVAPAIHCDDIIGGEYRATTGKRYYSRKEMVRDLEASGSTLISSKEIRNLKHKPYQSKVNWEKEATQNYYKLRDGMAPRLPEPERKILGED